MDALDTVILLFLFFLAGVGVGTFVARTALSKVLDAAKNEFISLRTAAEEKITEAENVIRQVKKAL
jgi:hypothetical protein